MTIGVIEFREFINAEHGEQFPERPQLQWATDIQSYGLTEQRNQLWPQPKRHWYINYEVLTDTDRDRLNELFNRGAGRYRPFLLKDKYDFQCTGENITTDGTAATYQLCKTYYSGESESWTENKKNIVPGELFAPVVMHNVDGAQTEVAAGPGADEFTLDDTTGVMTWSGGNEPSAGVLNVTFQFYFNVRFDIDISPEEKFTFNYWRANGVHIVEVPRL